MVLAQGNYRNAKKAIVLVQSLCRRRLGAKQSQARLSALLVIQKLLKQILKEWKIRVGNYLGDKQPIGMMHCFSGNFALATEYANLGFMISIPGTVTYPKNFILKDVVALLPLDKILIETDIPYLTPVPNRGKRNETAYINYTLDEIVKIRSEKKEFIAKNIYQNTIKLFKLEI